VSDRPDAPSPRFRWPIVALAAAAAAATAGGATLAGDDDEIAAAAGPAIATASEESRTGRGEARETDALRRARAAAPPPVLLRWRSPEVKANAALRKLARRAEAGELRDSTRVRDVLRRGLLLSQLDRDTHDRHVATWEEALEAADDLPGRRAKELGVVVDGVQRLADRGLLSASRMEPAFLMLRENTRLWRTAKLPGNGDRRTVADGAVVLQYYDRRGWQLQPLATWGEVNALAARCLAASQSREDGERTCPQQRKRLRERLDTLLDLAVPRGGRYPAWEYLFSYAGGSPPWVSGMAQATAAQALARAGSALDDDAYRDAAREVVGAFEHRPPLGVAVPGPDDGAHYALYSVQPDLRVLNAELQAVLALRDVTTLTGDTTARELYLRGDRAVRATLGRYDTGSWSRYSLRGRESDLGYHRLVRDFLKGLCERTSTGVYCGTASRFTAYLSESPRLSLLEGRRARAKRPAAVRFRLSKISCVEAVFRRGGRVVARKRLPYAGGTRSVTFTPPRAGRYDVRLEATDLRNHHTVASSTVTVRR